MTPKWVKAVVAVLMLPLVMLGRMLTAAAEFTAAHWRTAKARALPYARAFERNTHGFIGMDRVWTVIAVVILAVIIIQVLAKLAPTFIKAVADLVTAIETSSFNDTTADALRPIFGLLLALLGMLALVGLAFKAFGNSNGGY